QEAEAAGFEVFITADKNIRYQRNLTRRRIAILVLANAQWPILRTHVGRFVAGVNAATPGSYTEVQIPHAGYVRLFQHKRFETLLFARTQADSRLYLRCLSQP